MSQRDRSSRRHVNHQTRHEIKALFSASAILAAAFILYCVVYGTPPPLTTSLYYGGIVLLGIMLFFTDTPFWAGQSLSSRWQHYCQEEIAIFAPQLVAALIVILL